MLSRFAENELESDRIVETMQEVLEKAYQDEVTVVKRNPPVVQVWKSGTGLEVTASIGDTRQSLSIEISRIGGFLDSEHLPLKLGLGTGALYAMFRIWWQSQETAANFGPFVNVNLVSEPQGLKCPVWGRLCELPITRIELRNLSARRRPRGHPGLLAAARYRACASRVISV